ncbi:hypothetical protein HWD97_02590 [Ochrobactrum sp. C6C9]|uniref:hypothetical protein n=1 Tax=Ochrobactrum sp. C6C9 TaxID=2736662 RepID=UPI0035305223|nr:hypothetical protein [Ochrobactrum sp. C6C9]
MVWVGAALVLILALAIAPRLVFGIFLFGALGIGGILAYFYAEGLRAEKQRKLIVTTASTGNGCNDPQYPISITFTNNSRKQVEYVNFSLIGKREGYSSAIYDGYAVSDKILAPGSAYGACWPLSTYSFRDSSYKDGPFANLAWRAEINSVRFAK